MVRGETFARETRCESVGTFAYSRKTAEIEAEAALDGIYVIRTNVSPEHLDAPGRLSRPSWILRWRSPA